MFGAPLGISGKLMGEIHTLGILLETLELSLVHKVIQSANHVTEDRKNMRLFIPPPIVTCPVLMILCRFEAQVLVLG